MRRRFPFLLLAALSLALSMPSRAAAAGAAPPSVANATDGVFSQLPAAPRPTMREDPAMAYDPLRHRMIVFGGYGDGAATTVALNDLWTLSLGAHPEWAPLVAVGGPPPARLGHTMVYDSLRDRLVVFGGWIGSGGAKSDVWALSLAGTPTWTQLSPSGTGPGGRIAHAAIYDPVRDRMLVFGGYDGTTYRNDTWELDFGGGPHWAAVAAITPSGLTPRDLACAVYDPTHDRMVMCGGNALIGPGVVVEVGETWALQNLSGAPFWTQLPVTGLSPRLGAATAYDSTRQRLLVFGGYASGTYLSDAFSLDLAGSPSAWQPLAGGLPAPAARTFTAGAYDPGADRFVVFAGADVHRYFADACVLDLAGTGGWTVYDQPARRYAHSFVYDPNGRRGILFGGSTASTDLNDTWVFDLAAQSWSELLPTGTPPAPRAGQVAVLDEANDRLVVFGGESGGTLVNDVWALSLGAQPVWSRLADSGAGKPPELYLASGVYDALHRRLVVFGGYEGGATTSNVWSLALDGEPVWTAYPSGSGVPPGRYAAGFALDARHTKFLAFGGLDGLQKPLNDTWSLSLSLSGTADWTALPDSLPRGHFGQAVSVDTQRKRVIAIGGGTALGVDDGVYALPLDLSTNWTSLFPDGTPPAGRNGAGALFDPTANRVVLVDGIAPTPPTSVPFADTWFLTFPEIPTPVLTTLVDEMVDGASVHLTWYTPDGAGTSARAERTADGASWTALGTLVADGSGRLTLDDVVPADGRWGYRLLVGQAGAPTEVTWIATKGALAELSLGASPNPAVSTTRVAFSLRGSRPARLAVYDVRGRIVLQRDLSRLGPGAHSLALGPHELGGAGVYLLRLTEGDRSLTRKLALLP